MTSLKQTLDETFLRQLCSTPQGRATLLTQLSDAEGGSGGELDIFQHLLAWLGDDDEIVRLVTRHKEDEERHERLFKECAERQGVPLAPVPRELKLLQRIDDELGFFNRPVESRADVMEAYLLLLVIEERAMRQFALIENALRPHDPTSADVVREVRADEERHLRYCHAISKRMADDEAVRLRRLDELRALEARAFQQTSLANLEHHLAAKNIPSAAWRLVWRFTSLLGSVVKPVVEPLPLPA